MRSLLSESLRSNLKPFTHQHPSLPHIWHVLAQRANSQTFVFRPVFSTSSSPLVKGGHVKPRHSFHMCFLRPQLITAHMTYGSRIDGIWRKRERGRDGERHLSAYAELVRCGLAPRSHGSTRATLSTRSPAHEKGQGARSPKLAFLCLLTNKYAKRHRPHEQSVLLI